MSLFASKHLIQCSLDQHDNGNTMETKVVQFKLRAGMQTNRATTEFYRSSQETGMESHLEESAPTPVGVTYTKSIQVAGDCQSVPYFLYWATQGGANSSAASVASSNPTAYEHDWTGPNVSYAAKAFSMEDCGQGAAGGDADFNKNVANVTPDRVTISGRRSNTSNSVIDVSADLRGGGYTAGFASAPTSITWSRTKLYNFGMVFLNTSTTLPFDTFGTGWFNQATAPTSGANCITLGELTGSEVDMTASLQEFSLVATQDLDIERSMAPGNLDANYAAIVPDCLDWIYGPNAQQIELEMVFNQDDASGEAEKLGDEYSAGTRRSWELWIVHPGADAAPTPDLYYGIKVSLSSMVPLSWAEESNGFGERFVRVRYKAGYDTAANAGWHIAAVSNFNTMGG